MILILLYVAACCMGSAMRRWAIAAEADGCLSPAPTWTITGAGIYTCSAAMLGAIASSGVNGDLSGRLSIELATGLTAAHFAWGVRVIGMGIREVYGPAAGRAELAELAAILNRGVEGLAQTLRAPPDSCLQACRRHLHTTLVGVLSGGAAGLLAGLAENSTSRTVFGTVCTASAAMCTAIACANLYQATKHDEAGARNCERRRERPPRMGRRPARSDAGNKTQPGANQPPTQPARHRANRTERPPRGPTSQRPPRKRT